MTTLTLQIDHHSSTGFRLHVDTQIPQAGVTALFGPSGSGKTSLLNTIAGLRADVVNAVVQFGDTTWQDHTTAVPAHRRDIGYVFQDARLFPQLSVTDNLAYAERRSGRSTFSREQVTDWLGIGELLLRTPLELSAGQQQRVAIARALLRSPSLMLLDEPLANLDRTAAHQILGRLMLISRETQLPMLYVSHQIEEVSAIADRLLILHEGSVVAEGPLLDLASRLDNSLAEDEHAAAILEVSVGGSDSEYGLSELLVDGCSLWVSATSVQGDQRRLRVPARDVSICREPPTATSILNILPVTVVELRNTGSAHCLLRLKLREQHLLARITRKSRDELGLAAGETVYAQIKSTALLGDGGP